MSKKHKKKHADYNSNLPKNTVSNKSSIKSNTPLNISLLHFIPIGSAIIIFFMLWFKPYDVNIKDPWFEGAVLIDSANKITDRVEKDKIIEEAGVKLRRQATLHPYHARVQHLYGYYWFYKQNWDSAIFQQKEAIRLGAGGIVNSVEFNAQEMLNAALGNKVNPLIYSNKYTEALEVLENAKTANMYNPDIDKYKGLIFSRQGITDSALVCFLRYKISKPEDANNLANIAITYSQKNMRDSARAYINLALKSDPNNTTARSLINQLN